MELKILSLLLTLKQEKYIIFGVSYNSRVSITILKYRLV